MANGKRFASGKKKRRLKRGELHEQAVLDLAVSVSEARTLDQGLSLVLSSRGYRVIDARNGAEALEAYKRHPSDVELVVTDVVMPKLNGPELIEQLRKSGYAGKVLYVSGYTDDAVERYRLIESGCNLLRKPFAPDDLARKVREIFALPRGDSVGTTDPDPSGRPKP